MTDIGFDSPEVQAQMQAAFAAMQPAFQSFQETVQQTWAAVVKLVREFNAWFARWWSGLPVVIRRQFVARAETIMRRKVRHYALWCVRRQ